MLIDFEVENFRSYRGPKRLSMVASSGKELPRNLMELPDLDLTLVRSAVVYGPNASGKSNLLAATHCMGRMLSFPSWAVQFLRHADLGIESESDAGRDDPFDEVGVVFDTEGPQNLQRQRDARNACEQARELKFHTAVSNPSFEYWLLLHFKWFVGPIHDGDAACHLLKNHIPNYGKGADCFAIARPHTNTAIRHAKRVFAERHANSSHHPCDCHPSTEVYRLVESLLAES